MSRIHEALKKAAEERAARISAGVEERVAEAVHDLKPPVADVPRDNPAPRDNATPPVAEPSRDLRPPVTETVLKLKLPVADAARDFISSLAVEPPAPRPIPPSRLTPAAKPEEAAFSYEELIKRCVSHEWRLDPLNSVFLNSRPGEGGPERFRTLRSRLYKIASTRTLKKILITSGVASEGKTFVASNLAQSIVQQPELRVLLIDADLRSSRLHLLFGAPSCPGLSDYLRGDADEYAVMQKGMSENLFLIPGGSLVSNPSELLLSDRMKELLHRAAAVFDWIIIDSPPTLPVHDASILAEMVDGVLFVIRAGSTDAEIVERTAAEFQGKNLLGVVLNQVQRSDSYGDEYQNYYHQRD
jgi:protein-tyrosine kinase